MKVDTHSLLLDAAMFGAPTLGCRGTQWDAATLVPDQPAAKWEEPTAKVEAVEAAPPTCPAD
jgi:hypothetical protein